MMNLNTLLIAAYLPTWVVSQPLAVTHNSYTFQHALSTCVMCGKL